MSSAGGSDAFPDARLGTRDKWRGEASGTFCSSCNKITLRYINMGSFVTQFYIADDTFKYT